MVRGDEQPAVPLLDAEPGQMVEQLAEIGADRRVGGQQTEIFVRAGRLGVVVAGPDVGVAAQAVAVVAHDEHALGVRLQPDEAVDDMDAGTFEHLRPGDVRLLVEAGLELDEHRNLHAALGRPHQAGDDRAVPGRPVQGHLDRLHLRVVCRPADERFDGAGERFVRMMEQQVAIPDDREQAALLFDGVEDRRGRDRRPRVVLQILTIERVDHEQAGEIDERAVVGDVLVGEVELFEQHAEHVLGHAGLDLDAHRLAEPAAAELHLHRFEEVVGLLFFEREVGVAGDPEDQVLVEHHPREQVGELRRDDLFDGDHAVVAHGEEPWAGAGAP